MGSLRLGGRCLGLSAFICLPFKSKDKFFFFPFRYRLACDPLFHRDCYSGCLWMIFVCHRYLGCCLAIHCQHSFKLPFIVCHYHFYPIYMLVISVALFVSGFLCNCVFVGSGRSILNLTEACLPCSSDL